MSLEKHPFHKRPHSIQLRTYSLSGCFSILIIFSVIIPQAFALDSVNLGKITTYTTQGEPNKLAVQLSQGCITALKNHIKTGCPNYKDLSPPDNTNPGFYGKIIQNSNGDWYRSKPISPNYYNLVNSKDWIVAVDPTQSFIDGLKTKSLIVMAPGTLTSYASPDSIIGNNHTRTEYHDRYVNNICTEARIAYNYELYLDTIQYLESGCITTNYSDHELKKTNDTGFKLNSPYTSYVMDGYLRQVLHGHYFFSSVNRTNAGGLGPSNCQTGQCHFTDPYAKVGYK